MGKTVFTGVRILDGSGEEPFAGEVLQSRDIGLELLLRFEIDVEADQVEKRQLQIPPVGPERPCRRQHGGNEPRPPDGKLHQPYVNRSHTVSHSWFPGI